MTQLDTHARGRIPLNERSARRRGHYLQNTQQMQETNIHALIGIRIRDPSNRAAVDLSLRPHGRWDRHILHFISSVVLSVSQTGFRKLKIRLA
jgi:hypothetical protein